MEAWIENLTRRLNALSVNANHALRENPAKWSGIATGAGLGIGLLSRFLRRRSHRRRRSAIIIIDATR
jgi:hypothetical protein